MRFSYNNRMKLMKLDVVFLSALLGLGLCSFSSGAKTTINDNQSNVANVNNVLNENEDLGTLSSGLDVQLRNYAITELGASFQVYVSASTSGTGNENFYVGYRGEGERNLPASLRFSVQTSDGNIETRTAPLNKAQNNNLYDGLGSSLGANYLSTFCDIPLAYGEKVLYDKGVELFNVFTYDRESKQADFESPLYCECTYAALDATVYPAVFDSTDFFELTYQGASNFANYSAFSFKVLNFGTELYPNLTSATARAYRTHESNLVNGTSYVRSALSFGGNTYFNIYYSDGSVEKIYSSAKNYEITNGGDVIFLFEGLETDNVTNIEICDLYYNMDIFSYTTKAIISRTNFSQRFGRIYTKMSNLENSSGVVEVEKVENSYLIDSNLVVGLIFGISTFIFLASVIPSYFYLKKKNRNDEFKRMNTKSYVTTASYGYVCIESLLLLITFVTIRSTIFNNALTVFNPTDAYIVVFGVISIILVGYFIRYFVLMIKNNIEKRNRDKLKINQDVIDDGTLIIRK